MQFCRSAVSACWFNLVRWQNRKPGELTPSDLRNRCGKHLSFKIRDSATCAITFACDPLPFPLRTRQELSNVVSRPRSPGNYDGESQIRSKVYWLLTITQPRNVT